MGYFRNNYGDQDIYISGQKLRGVQSTDASFSIPFEPIKVAGVGYLDNTINSNLEGSVSVNRYVVSNEDPITGFFTQPISGHLRYGTGNNPLIFSFHRGQINSYSSSCSVGGVPELNFEISAYGNIGSGVSTGIEQPNNETIAIARPGDIIFEGVSGQSTNRIQSYNYEISVPRTPIYVLGSGFEPAYFNIDYPIEINLSFDMDVDDLQSEDMHDLVCNQPKNDISITLSGCNLNNFLRKFILPNPIFLGVDYSSSIDNDLSATIRYKSYINNINDIAPLIGGGQIFIDVNVVGGGTVQFVEFFD